MTEKKKSENIMDIVRETLNGEALDKRIISKYWKIIIWVIVLCLIFIGNRYTCRNKLLEIQFLTSQMQRLENENLSLSTEITIRSRQAQIEDILKEKGIQLGAAKTPAIEIHK